MSDISDARQDPEAHGFPPDSPAVTGATDVVIGPSDIEEAAMALPLPLVGIGLSAGGLEPLMDLFANLPANTGMAFVVVPHLARDQKSHLAEIVGRKTAMPVVEIVDHTRPEPNHVYVLPPTSSVTMGKDRKSVV